MIVVDTNVIAYLFIEGAYTQQAKKLFLKDPDWIAPMLWRSEFRNVLAQYIRGGHLSLKNAQLLISEAENLMRGKEYDVTSHDVLECIAISECSSYDCEFVALARRKNLKLYTSDKKILLSFSDLVLALSEI